VFQVNKKNKKMSIIIQDPSGPRNDVEQEAIRQIEIAINSYIIGENKQMDSMQQMLRVIKMDKVTGKLYIDKKSFYTVYWKNFFVKAKKDLGVL